MELHVRDTELTIPAGRGVCTKTSHIEKMRREKPSGRHSECKTIKVDSTTMNKLWR